MRVVAPIAEPAPAVFDSPHSGRAYPDDFVPALPVAELHFYEDRLVDRLIARAPEHGVTLVVADFPRAYIDPNRSEDDLDAEVTGPDWAGTTRPVYAPRGIGLIFRTSLSGTPIYEGPLGAGEIERRIERYWRPYHEALEQSLDAAEKAWGAVWHVSWHSMRPIGDALSADPGAVRPDFVLSDRDGASCEPAFIDLVERELAAMGYSLARNTPFKGGYITALHGRPEAGRHSLQVEINRALYLEPDSLEPAAGAKDVERNLTRLSAAIADFSRSRARVSRL